MTAAAAESAPSAIRNAAAAAGNGVMFLTKSRTLKLVVLALCAAAAFILMRKMDYVDRLIRACKDRCTKPTRRTEQCATQTHIERTDPQRFDTDEDEEDVAGHVEIDVPQIETVAQVPAVKRKRHRTVKASSD